MRNISILVVIICVLLVAANVASADTIRGIDMDFVTIGNAGNAGDTRAEANPSGAGAVAYTYQLGKYEVTNGQWDTFVSAAGAPTGNPSNAYDESAFFTGTNVPTNEVSWYEAAQFCNYLTSGDKSQGAYQFSNGDFTGIDRASAISSYGIAYVIPTEDEWYKAAYYTGSGFSTYANGTNTEPSKSQACYDGYSSPWNIGTGMQEQNGTFDMMGNVFEWNESLFSSHGGLRGGSYINYKYDLGSSNWYGNYPYDEGSHIGFRIAAVPEPCSLVLLSLGGLMVMGRRKN